MEGIDSRSSSDTEDEYWKGAHWNGGRLPEVGPRGYFTLFVHQSEQREAWDKIARLTQEDQLGYYSAIAPSPMYSGQYEGYFAICVHTFPATFQEDKDRVKNVLIQAGFGDNIQHYRVSENNPANRAYNDMLRGQGLQPPNL